MDKVEFELPKKRNNKPYVGNFIDNLDKDTYGKMIKKLEAFQKHEVLGFQNSKHTTMLDKKTRLCQVKTRINKSWLRLLGRWTGNIFYIVHGFVKKGNRTPPNEIKTANNKLKEIFG